MPSVRFDRRAETWVVRGEFRSSGPEGDLILVEQDLVKIPVVDLRRAMLSACQWYGTETATAQISLLPEDYFDADAPVGPIEFELIDGQLGVSVLCLVEWPHEGDESTAIEGVRRLVTPFLASIRSDLIGIDEVESWSSPVQVAVRVRMAVPWRGKSAADLIRVGQNVLDLCEALSSGSVNRETVADLVRGGGARLLVDQPEGPWLDAKSEEYELASIKGKISLAQAVARFANAEDGGLIVIGAKAKKVPGGEVIRNVSGVVPRQSDTVARYLRVLDQHLYPPVYGIRIDLVPGDDRKSLVVVDVPPQPEELKPFLVHGAITTEGEAEGSFISLVQRRGEGSIPITAPMIHATLAAGRALLRRQSSRPSSD